MADIQVRQATLDDTQAISRLFQARIPVWQRMSSSGQVESVSHMALTIYERWLHGGAWMSIETAAIQLSRLLSGAGIALVAVVKDDPLAFVQAYSSSEPPPFGNNVQLAELVVHPDHIGERLETALIDHLLEQTAQHGQRLTTSRIANTTGSADFQQHYRLNVLAQIRRVGLTARAGQIFYRATDHVDDDAAQIEGWSMPVGRTGNAREQWEALWTRTWDAIPEIRERRTHRLQVAAAGQEAFVCLQQQLYDSRSADVYCWSPKPLSNQLLSAIRDWTHREGYRALGLAVTEETMKSLGTEAEPDIYRQDVCEILPS
jgi:GNAT superfamily N-acetyltransferase